MAEVGTPGSLATDPAHLCGGGAMKLKRKTPSELRESLSQGTISTFIDTPMGSLCVIGLAPAHVALQAGVSSVNFNVGKSDRSEFKVIGKRKTVLCGMGELLSSSLSSTVSFASDGIRKCIYTIPAHSRLISQVKFEPKEGYHLVTASYDRTAKKCGRKINIRLAVAEVTESSIPNVKTSCYLSQHTEHTMHGSPKMSCEIHKTFFK